MNEPLKAKRKCAMCGKDFIIHPGRPWIYKHEVDRRMEWYCGYTCSRRAEAMWNGYKAEHRAHRKKGEPVPGGTDTVQPGVQME